MQHPSSAFSPTLRVNSSAWAKLSNPKLRSNCFVPSRSTVSHSGTCCISSSISSSLSVGSSPRQAVHFISASSSLILRIRSCSSPSLASLKLLDLLFALFQLQLPPGGRMVRTYASASCGGTATGRLTEKAPTTSCSTSERIELRTSAHRLLFGRAPSVCSACKLGDRGGCNSRPDLGLHVALDRRFRCPATFFTPHDHDLGARFAVFHVDTR